MRHFTHFGTICTMSRFLSCTNGTKSCKAPHMIQVLYQFIKPSKIIFVVIWRLFQYFQMLQAELITVEAKLEQ